MWYRDRQIRGLPVGGILTVLGSFLSLLFLGAFYTFGNVMPYFVSYMRNVTGEDITYSEFNNVNLAFGISSAIAQTIAPIVLVPLIGHKNIMFLGMLCTVSGCLLTRWALEVNLLMVTLSYGFLQGLGMMALIPDYFMPMMWFPNKRGFVMGICIGGYGISSTLWSQLQLAIANPNNVEAITPAGAESDDAYFEDPDVLDRVPTLIYVTATLYAIFLTIAFLLVSEPPKGEDSPLGSNKKPKKFWEIDYKKASDGILKNVINRRQFYQLMAVRFGFTICIYTVPAYYKAFGLALDYDDAFITLWVSTLSGLSQMTSRFVYGTLLDVVPFSLLVGVQSLILGTAFVFFYPVALLGEVPYVLWLHLIYITFPGIYAILPAKGREEFGEKYGPIVVGSIALSDIILLLSIGIISEAILDDTLESYLLYFVIMAVGPLIAFASAVTFPTSEDDRRKWRRIKKCLS